MNQCQFKEKIPVFSKKIGDFSIDASEFVNERGAHIMDKQITCRTVTDLGEKFCPKHKALAEATHDH